MSDIPINAPDTSPDPHLSSAEMGLRLEDVQSLTENTLSQSPDTQPSDILVRFPDKSPAELQQLALDIFQNRVFCDYFAPPDLFMAIFMVFVFLSQEEMKAILDAEPG